MSDVFDHKTLIKNFFLSNKGEWYTAAQIAQKLSIVGDKTQRGVRQACKELLYEGFPICTGDKGFIYTSDVSLLLGFKAHMEDRVLGLKRGIRAIDDLIAGRQLVFSGCDYSPNGVHNWLEKGEEGVVCMWCQQVKIKN